MIRAEAEAALAEYEAELVMGEPEENHQRLAAILSAYLIPITHAMVEAGAKVLDPEAFEVPLRGYGEGAAAQARESAIQAAREVLEAAETAR